MKAMKIIKIMKVMKIMKEHREEELSFSPREKGLLHGFAFMDFTAFMVIF